MNAQALFLRDIESKIHLMSKEYTNGEITIKWQPSLCKHAGVCARTLPEVYRPKEKPWIKMENASTEELKKQINRCPSGALSFTVNE